MYFISTFKNTRILQFYFLNTFLCSHGIKWIWNRGPKTNRHQIKKSLIIYLIFSPKYTFLIQISLLLHTIDWNKIMYVLLHHALHRHIRTLTYLSKNSWDTTTMTGYRQTAEWATSPRDTKRLHIIISKPTLENFTFVPLWGSYKKFLVVMSSNVSY